MWRREEAVLVISLSDNKLHCAILSQNLVDNIRFFSDDKSHIPAALDRAMNNPDFPFQNTSITQRLARQFFQPLPGSSRYPRAVISNEAAALAPVNRS